MHTNRRNNRMKKKIRSSIGGYTLRNFESNVEGIEGYGFGGELWKDKIKIGTLKDWGDGGSVNSVFEHENRESNEIMVLKDMKKLMSLIHPDEDSLGTRFDYNSYSAMEGFAELLLDFEHLSELYLSVKKKDKGEQYAVFSTGNHWFRKFVGYDECYTLDLSKIKEEECLEKTKNAIIKGLDKNRMQLTMLRIVKGPRVSWAFTFEEYARMFEDAKKLLDN